ncbi:hypothetical protein IIB49_00985 [Patescibacteria group bacterium]|nr:hypothetical protein [Patescibacteria group bacterium]
MDINIELNIASELMVASVFFFALFSGFFIARQNDRYTKIIGIIAERDGLFSYLYRVFGLVPRMQSEIREIIKKHYTKILESNNWAYNEFNPSTTITRLTQTMGSITKEEVSKIDGYSPYDGIWDTILQLQQIRKKIIAAYNERLLLFQWVLIYVFAGLVVLSFHFLQTDSFLVDVIKIVFGTAVFLVVILIKQLNDLSIFGKDFSYNIAHDVLRILDEVDVKEIKEREPGE